MVGVESPLTGCASWLNCIGGCYVSPLLKTTRTPPRREGRALPNSLSGRVIPNQQLRCVLQVGMSLVVVVVVAVAVKQLSAKVGGGAKVGI